MQPRYDLSSISGERILIPLGIGGVDGQILIGRVSKPLTHFLFLISENGALARYHKTNDN